MATSMRCATNATSKILLLMNKEGHGSMCHVRNDRLETYALMDKSIVQGSEKYLSRGGTKVSFAICNYFKKSENFRLGRNLETRFSGFNKMSMTELRRGYALISRCWSCHAREPRDVPRDAASKF